MRFIDSICAAFGRIRIAHAKPYSLHFLVNAKTVSCAPRGNFHRLFSTSDKCTLYISMRIPGSATLLSVTMNGDSHVHCKRAEAYINGVRVLRFYHFCTWIVHSVRNSHDFVCGRVWARPLRTLVLGSRFFCRTCRFRVCYVIGCDGIATSNRSKENQIIIINIAQPCFNQPNECVYVCVSTSYNNNYV